MPLPMRRCRPSPAAPTPLRTREYAPLFFLFAEESTGQFALQVLAFAGNAHSIADPEDAGTLDVTGLDSGVPEVIRQFVLGELS